MRNFRRRLFAIVSLTLAATAIALAVRGQFVSDWIPRVRTVMHEDKIGFRVVGIQNFTDTISLVYFRSAWRALPTSAYEWASDEPGRSAYTGSMPIEYHRRVGTTQSSIRHAVHVKHWLTISVTSILAVLLNWRAWRRRPGPGHCQTCGYDLRATPQRCPECGRVAATLE